MKILFFLFCFACFQVFAQDSQYDSRERPPRDEETRVLTEAQKEKVKSILSSYDPNSLTPEEARSIHKALKQAGLRGGRATNEAIREAGFDPVKLRDLAPPPRREERKLHRRDLQPQASNKENPELPQRIGLWISFTGAVLAIIIVFIRLRHKNKQRTRDNIKTPFDNDDRKTLPMNVEFMKTGNLRQRMIASLPKRYIDPWDISKGGMGLVLGANDTLLKRKVAIKMILPSLSEDEKMIQRFINEACSIAALDHPNILKIFDVGGEPVPFFVMEYLEGISLEQWIDQKGKMTDEEIKYYGSQMADAFKYCHEKNIIHRDIKPANIIIVNNLKTVKIVDFGISKNSFSPGLTQTNESFGTPEFMAPEQINANQCGIASDIYSFGLTLYNMATGKLPFDGKDMVSRLTIPPAAMALAAPDLNNTLGEMIMKCIEIKPEARFKNFDEIHRILLEIQN